MKKMFTQILRIAALSTLLMGAVAANAQEKITLANLAPAKKTSKVDSLKGDTLLTNKSNADAPKKADDPSWTPVRRLWGYGFGDLYYAPHVDAGSRGPETMYNGVPSNRNAFQFRRLYLGYDYEINKKFVAEVLLASEPNANTGVNGATSIQNGDNLVDGKMAFWIKNFNLRVRDIWAGTDLVVGEMSTPGFALINSLSPSATNTTTAPTNAPSSLSEATWGYRFIEKTITDFHKNNSYDVGAALQGTFDPATKNFGYVIMVGNNSTSSLLSAANANTGFYKIFYFDLWGKFLDKKLVVDLYADYAPTAAATAAIGGQNHSIKKIFAAYSTKPISIGVEAYTQSFTNGISSTAFGPQDATANGISLWLKGNFSSTWGWFARYDSYNPYTNYNNATTYTVNTNYSSYTPTYKEQFVTAGLDFQPAPKIHFSPNLWYINYKDQRDPSTTGYVAGDHTLVLRATFYYTFGK
jgi:hypothetical protein